MTDGIDLTSEGFLAVAPDLYYWGSRLGCMGAGYALALAPNLGYAAVSVNYGGCPSDAQTWLAEACPIVGSYGAADRSPLGSAAGRRLESVLADHDIPHHVKVYPGVGHGFMNDHDPATLLLRFLARVSGTRYDEDATQDARRRITEFFDTHLRDSPAGTTGQSSDD